MRPLPGSIKSITFALLVFTAACQRDTVAPERAVVVPAQASSDHDDAGDGSSVGRVITFEDFTLGAIDEQYDWQSRCGMGAPPPAVGPACGVRYDHQIADNASVIPARFRVRSLGQRSLRISNAVTSGNYSDQTFSSRTANVAGQRGARSKSKDGLVDYALAGAVRQNHYEAEWTVMSTVPNALQPGLEVVASPARGDDARMSWVQMADLPRGLAVVFAERSDPASPGAFERSIVAQGLDRREAHTIKLTMDFVDGPGNDVVRVYVDGSLRHTGTSWETYYALDDNGKANFGGAPPAINRLMFRTGSDLHRGVPGDPAPATRGHGFVIDNLRQATFMVATSSDACKNGGWHGLRDMNGATFESQGDCVNWVRRAQQRDNREH
jgi:hypothetical protein